MCVCCTSEQQSLALTSIRSHSLLKLMKSTKYSVVMHFQQTYFCNFSLPILFQNRLRNYTITLAGLFTDHSCLSNVLANWSSLPRQDKIIPKLSFSFSIFSLSSRPSPFSGLECPGSTSSLPRLPIEQVISTKNSTNYTLKSSRQKRLIATLPVGNGGALIGENLEVFIPCTKIVISLSY